MRSSIAGHASLTLVAVAAATALVALFGVSLDGAPALAGVTAPAAADPTAATGPPYPPGLIVKTEMRLKADLISRNLSGSPQLVFFGGSRSQRFDPVFALRRLGLRSVNLALSCARPESAWAYANWIYKHWPDAKLRWVWGMQAPMLIDDDLDAALLQDPRFYRYFPDRLLAQQRKRLPRTVAQMPRSYGFLHNGYSSLGMLTWNVYDARFAAGYTLDQSLDDYIAKMLHQGRRDTGPAASRASEYFEKTVALLNAHGTTPVVVLMPVHPRVLRVQKEHGMGGEREQLRQYLDSLAGTLDMCVLDYTRIQSFNGESRWFYDGVHITRSNANRLIVALQRQAGEYLK